ncbi:hypothetical protein [Desertibacillus haloalkaliphilus]|uniref:hypothetical protein n=1 Tax=Desertibacillus haloalkaliphilus TaxID=1328930 RepID=UPI001C26F935|nr:hypothetical protein [Desertibacillus haloalkaliphilus]
MENESFEESQVLNISEVEESFVEEKGILSEPDNGEYSEVEQLGLIVGKALFDFYNLSMTPEEYLSFIDQYGSTRLKEKMVDDPDETLVTLNNVQSILRERDLFGQEYTLSEIILDDENENEAIMHRVTILEDGQREYYRSLFVKENGHWMLEDDRPGEPFTIEQELENFSY